MISDPLPPPALLCRLTTKSALWSTANCVRPESETKVSSERVMYTVTPGVSSSFALQYCAIFRFTSFSWKPMPVAPPS